jgi:hypothetical protein
VGEKRPKIAAVVSTFVKQADNLPTCLTLLKPGVDYIILCYNVQDGRKKKDPRLPPEVTELASETIYTAETGQYPGEGKCVKEGLRRAVHGEFPYTLKINGDVFLGKGENIPCLIQELDGYDFIAPQWHTHYKYSSTMMFFGKTDPLFEAYKTVSLEGNDQLERRWYRAFKTAKLKFKMSPYATTRSDLEKPEKNGMWGELLGFRHIHGEINGL